MIKLYGKLAKEYTRELDARVSSIGEAIRCLDANYPGFRNSIIRDGRYAIRRGDSLLKNAKNISEEEVLMNFSDKETYHILPIPVGAGDNSLAIFTIIAGVILIAASFYTGGATAGPGAKLLGVGAGLGGFIGSMGVALALGGVAMMMAPSPTDFGGDSRDSGEGRKSYIFNGAVNTVEPGTTIPLVYGESFIGSTFISGRLKINDITG
jgi:predicted phage tail protein